MREQLMKWRQATVATALPYVEARNEALYRTHDHGR
jgi:hypothetical protein